jgi:hypothetical protein
MCDESAMSTNFTVNVATYNANTFLRAEVAYQGANVEANTFGIVVSFDRPAGVLRLRNIRGSFTNGSVIVGNTSNARATLGSYNILDNATIPQGDVADNVIIETEAGTLTAPGVLDFSERNPFGEP